MRAFIYTLIIFILIIAGLFFYSVYMTESIDELSLLLSDTETHLEKGDFSSARASAETFSDTLKEKSYTLYFFTDRCPIDNTLTESERLNILPKNEDRFLTGR